MTLSLVIAVGSGCASWKDPTSLSSLFQDGEGTSTLSADRQNGTPNFRSNHVVKSTSEQVLLDVMFVHARVEDLTPDQMTSLWQWVDETSIDLLERKSLLANGLRAGLVTNEKRFKNQLEQSIATQDVVDQFLSSASIATDGSEGSDRIPMRMGQSYELPVGRPLEGEQVTLVRVAGETLGRTLPNPQYLFSVTPVELMARQQFHLRLRPEIQFGQVRQKWVGSKSALRIDQRRETWSLPSMDLNLNVKKGDLLVITKDAQTSLSNQTAAHGGNGSSLAAKMMIGKNADQQNEQLFLLVRILDVPKSSS